MEIARCIFCGMSGDNVVISENGYYGIKCANCSLIYISPRPAAAEITYLYTDYHAVQYADAQFQFERFGRKVAARALSKIRHHRKSGSILELGPGGGFFLLEARKYGYDPYGIELNPIEARWINENMHIPCETNSISKSSFHGRKFDIIYHKDVLSHLYDPIGVFRAINQSMTKTGLLVFETGNIPDVKEKRYKWISEFHYPDHLFFFGEKSLGILLERTGFNCLQVYKEAILMPILLEKLLWIMKDPLKDNRTDLKSKKDFYPARSRQLSMKRRLRLGYRYVNHYLAKFGAILPKNGWPLKLLVIAEKRSDLE